MLSLSGNLTKILLVAQITLFSPTFIHTQEIITSCAAEFKPNGFTLLVDWGDVLMTPSTTAGLKILGSRPLKNYFKAFPKHYLKALAHNPLKNASLLSYFKIKNRVYQFLHTVKPRTPGQAPSRDSSGNLLPQIMCDHMTTPLEQEAIILEQIHRAAHSTSGFFRTKAEKKLILAIVDMMFSKRVVESCIPDKEALKKLKKWKKQGYRLVLFSNQSESTFQALKHDQPELIELFDDCIISARVGAIKPDLIIYEHALKNIDPFTVFLIDDRPENLKQAALHGITPLLCTKTWLGNPDIEAVDAKLQRETRKKRSALSH